MMERQTFGTMQKVAKHTVNLLYGYARWFDGWNGGATLAAGPSCYMAMFNCLMARLLLGCMTVLTG